MKYLEHSRMFGTMLFWQMQFMHSLFQMNFVCRVENLYFRQVRVDQA